MSVYSPNPVLIQATSKTYLFGELNNNLVEYNSIYYMVIVNEKLPI